MTRQIQALEKGLGVELLVRTSHGVQLTEAGRTLLDDARNIAALAEQSVDRAQMAGHGDAGRLDIGFFGTSALDILPRVLAAYRRKHPRVKLMLHPGQTPALVLALRQGRVAVVFERQLPQEADIGIELVAQERVLVALPAGHRLARTEVVDVDELRDEPMILPEGLPPQMSGMAATIFKVHGFEPREAQRCLDLTSGTLLVACGVGVFLIPASMAVVQMPGVIYRPLKSRSAATFDLYCFYRRDHESPLVDGLLAVVRELRTKTRPDPRQHARLRSGRAGATR